MIHGPFYSQALGGNFRYDQSSDKIILANGVTFARPPNMLPAAILNMPIVGGSLQPVNQRPALPATRSTNQRPAAPATRSINQRPAAPVAGQRSSRPVNQQPAAPVAHHLYCAVYKPHRGNYYHWALAVLSNGKWRIFEVIQDDPVNDGPFKRHSLNVNPADSDRCRKPLTFLGQVHCPNLFTIIQNEGIGSPPGWNCQDYVIEIWETLKDGRYISKETWQRGKDSMMVFYGPDFGQQADDDDDDDDDDEGDDDEEGDGDDDDEEEDEDKPKLSADRVQDSDDED